MRIDLIFNPIVKSKWRKVYLILLLLFTIYVLFLIRIDISTLKGIKEFIRIFIFNIYLKFFLPISFFIFSLKWCVDRYRFLSWEEVIRIVIYSLIFFITFIDIFFYLFVNTQLWLWNSIFYNRVDIIYKIINLTHINPTFG